MIKRRILIQLLALMVVLPATAVADNLPALPVPKITDAPKSMPEGPGRTVHFSFATTPQSISGYTLNYHVQQWYCPPGKDVTPTDISIQAVPFGDQQPSCKLEENWGGLSHGGTTTITSGSVLVPVQGEPHLDPGTLYLRASLWWSGQGGSVASSGGWSAWHRTLVEDTHRAEFTGAKGMRMQRRPVGSMHIKVDMSGAKPPVIMVPSEGHVFHGDPINISGSVGSHNPYGDWTCCFFEWKRAVIVTPENNAYAKPGHSAFPTPPTPWSGQGFFSNDALGVKEQGPSFHGRFLYNDIRPHDHTFGYRYMFRVREEHYDQYGPWSPWRSFIVQEPVGARMMSPGSMHVQPGAHMAAPSSGQQHNSQQRNSRKLVPMAPMHFR